MLQSTIQEDIRQHSALIILDMHVLFLFKFEHIVYMYQASKPASKHVCTNFHVIHWYLIQSHQHQQHNINASNVLSSHYCCSLLVSHGRTCRCVCVICVCIYDVSIDSLILPLASAGTRATDYKVTHFVGAY